MFSKKSKFQVGKACLRRGQKFLVVKGVILVVLNIT
jgi:hypothetical protein